MRLGRGSSRTYDTPYKALMDCVFLPYRLWFQLGVERFPSLARPEKTRTVEGEIEAYRDARYRCHRIFIHSGGFGCGFHALGTVELPQGGRQTVTMIDPARKRLDPRPLIPVALQSRL